MPERPLAACGTYAAARRHQRHNQPLDDACRHAVTIHNRRRTSPICTECRQERAPGDGAYGRCGACYQAWRRAGRPADTPRSLKASDSGYSLAYGTARLDVAS